MASAQDPNRMVTIHAGPVWDLELLAMRLEEAGIDSMLPDKLSIAADPFLDGAETLASRLQVRAADAERAAVVVERARARLRGAQGGAAAVGAGGNAGDAVAPREQVERLSRRTRWAALFGLLTMGLTLPLALLTGWSYLRQCRAHGIRSRAHGMTLAAVAFSLCAVFGFALLWWVVAD